MVSLYSGTPGSGKSLHIAERIYRRIQQRRPIIANFEIKKRGIKKWRWSRKRKRKKSNFVYVPNYKMDPALLIQYSKDYLAETGKKVVEGEILLVIDEAQIVFNARSWSQKGRDDWLSFFTQHRKYGFDIVLIAQFDLMIDKQIRSLIEYEYIHRKLSNFGIVGFLMSLFAFGKVFVAVKVWYPLGERVGREMFIAKKKYYSIYDTFGDFGSADKIEEKKAPAKAGA